MGVLLLPFADVPSLVRSTLQGRVSRKVLGEAAEAVAE
jgi:histone H3/H4